MHGLRYFLHVLWLDGLCLFVVHVFNMIVGLSLSLRDMIPYFLYNYFTLKSPDWFMQLSESDVCYNYQNNGNKSITIFG